MSAGGGPRSRAGAILIAISACCAAATALWLLPASIHIVRWEQETPARLALLRPAWQLAVALAAGGAVGTGLALRAPAAARELAPVNLMWLWAVPYAPWIADRFPLLLVLAGPARWIAPAFVAAAFVVRTNIWRRVAGVTSGASRAAILVVSFVVYAVSGISAVRTNGIIGDEPHYLIITESVRRDGDLRIENNHQQRDYQAFFGGQLRPDFMQRGQDGAIYSIHAPGLPILVLPAYAVAGLYGVVVFLALLASLCALAVFDVAEALAGRTAAVVTWLAVAFTAPLVPYAWSIFPELPGALIVAWAVKWLIARDDVPVSRWLLRGAVLGALPWLHTKFVVFAALFGLAFALRLWPKIRQLAALLVPLGASGFAWLYSFYAIYGRFDPEAPYGGYTDVYVLTRNIPHGLLGLFFDQKFGLLFYSPIYVAAIVGAWLLWRKREQRFLVLVLAAIVLAFAASTARLYMFWGGSSAPARFLVPIVPCLAPLIAMAIAHARTAFARSMVSLSISIGLVLSAAAILWPRRLLFFSDPHGRARWLELLQGPSPLASVIPTFTDPDWTAHIVPLAAWIATALVAVAAGWAAARSGRWPAWRSAVVTAITLLVGGSVLTARPSAAVREETAMRGDLALLTRFDGDRFRTLDYTTLSRVAPDRLFALATIEMLPPASVDERGFISGPTTLPPGRYEAQIWFTSSRPRDGRITVRALSQAIFASTEGPLQNPVTLPFALPVTVRRLMIAAEGSGVAAAVSRVAIVPRDIVPPPGREEALVRVVEGIPHRPGAYLAYVDGAAYPEHGTFWSRGTARTTVLVAPGGARQLTLHLATGPRSGEVTVAVGGEERRVAMAADRPNQLSFDLPAGVRLVPLTVQSNVMFRPGEVDPRSGDMRGLGCQVQITLE
jgi:hypothetical protein